MNYTASEIAAIIHTTETHLAAAGARVSLLLTDSRSLLYPAESIFFALVTKQGDGHKYIPALYGKGVRNFVVSRMPDGADEIYADANFLVVNDTVKALQQLAAAHRHRFDIPVIAITGSRGKTTVKEWLYRILCTREEIVRSPRSFNSHIGVPLSLWELEPATSLGIFEAGVSQEGEMAVLREMISPTVAVITNVGHEHDEGFTSLDSKAAEKALIAGGASTVVYPADDPRITGALAAMHLQAEMVGWSRRDKSAPLYINAVVNLGDETEIEYVWRGSSETHVVETPLTDEAAVENVITCIATALACGASKDDVAAGVRRLAPVDTRIEVMEGVNDCLLLLDGYTSDLRSLGPALDFMTRRTTEKRSLTVILSDLTHENRRAPDVYKAVGRLLEQKNVTRLIGIGSEISKYGDFFSGETRFFPDTEAFAAEMSTSDFDHELILIKGAPDYGFHRISESLEARQHETVLEVNLDAMVHNYNFFKSFLRPTTGIVAMVKASAYGAGACEIAKTLQSAGAAYLAVAAHDEGVSLRAAGVTMPVMVLNPKVVNYPALFVNRLEPAVYNFETLHEIIREGEKCGVSDYPVHIKIDSGMHRVGFLREELPELLSVLMGQQAVQPASVFSHLAAADDPDMDDYTRAQFAYFADCADRLQEAYPQHHIKRHILNSTGIVRFPEHQLDMVRLGIGLYGIATLDDGSMDTLRPISSLHTVIISIKEWNPGVTVGYNRRGKITRPSRIATLPIGYADGLNRHLGNGNTHFCINGVLCPTVGNICMDLCMVDVTDVPGCRIGDRAEIFGENVTAASIAETLGTIPYEVLTSVSSRVKRIYFRE